jgi:3alpha(or 20beta)-hydroxysteroid dehydrogenase
VARGKGAAHARALSAEGAHVLMCDVLDDDGRAAAAELRADGLDVDYRHLDVRSEDDWREAVDALVRDRGRVDVLVNNAAVVRDESVEDETLDGWSSVIAVNQTGVFLGMRQVVPAMRAGGGGSIVNIASTWGCVGARGHVAYQASKGAVRILTKNAAVTYAADGIRVNCVCPGIIDTAMLDEEVGTVNEDELERTLLHRLGRPEEVATAVVFLACDESSFVTGIDLVVDGGFLVQ